MLLNVMRKLLRSVEAKTVSIVFVYTQKSFLLFLPRDPQA